MTCPSCGSAVPPSATSCPSCGVPVQARPPVTLASARRQSVITGEERTVIPTRSGDVLSGRYRLEKKIGEGGMGSVYVAHDLELDRPVAVKMLAQALVNDPELVERFEREARLMAKLDHPNLVPIYDVGRHEGRPFLVMKLLEGHSLVDLLKEKGGFTAPVLLSLMKQLAAGLDHIHARGFIHRDIKSGNIFVGPDGHATILDFGILRSRSPNQSITRMGMVMGTPHYMAPEQALGLKTVDHRVDLYALAVVLFECLSGSLPFEADSEIALIQMQAHTPPPDILLRAPWVSKPVAQFMRRALAKNPDERFNSGAELVKALEAAQAAPAVDPSMSAPELKAVTPKKMRRALIGFSVLAVVGALVAQFALRGAPVEAVADAGVPAVAVVDSVPDAAVTPVAVVEASDAAVVIDLDAGGSDTPDTAEPGDAGAARELLDGGPIGSPLPLVIQAPRRKGALMVTSTHRGDPFWADVSIDGKPVGRSPTRIDALLAGPHKVGIQRSGFRAQVRWVTVQAGKTVPVKFELTP